ncbi:MAG: hypothetical protein GIX03_00890 [Candidatus Eremiobacteraeota bacterium]|nr:hypothetical protein [Candidatus Eremiobacteraeota bacterium]MBC5801579.1 hypothetical protein [Candidatus Eremiobacteraeota bacterium]MBC5821700.1 hypothetical protein [Candidatus Eremiobacteraeota bacterium]
MKYAWLVIGIFAARFFATAIAYPAGDGDLAWQRRLGSQILRSHRIPQNLGSDTFTAPFHPWIAQEWLFSIAAALGRSGAGWWLFAGFCAAAAVAALLVAARDAERRGASARAIALCTALAGIALFASFGVRVQVVAWPLAALFLLLLDGDGTWAYGAIVVAGVWSNVHASALLAPLAAAAAACGTWLDEKRWNAGVRRAFVVAAGCALAVCCNPFGLKLPLYAFGLVTSDFKRYITEWQPTSLWDPTFAFGALPLLLIALTFLARSERHRWRDVCVLAPFAFLLFGAARNIALFGIVAAPLAACALTRNVAWFGRTEPPRDRRARYFETFALPGFAAMLAVIVALALVRTRDPAADALGTRALVALRAIPGRHRLLCADFAWCGQAVGAPRISVFLDGRADPYPNAVWSDFVTIAGLHARWHAELDAHAVDAVLVAVDAPLDQALVQTHGWHSVYRDHAFRLWLRGARNASSIQAAPRGARPDF